MCGTPRGGGGVKNFPKTSTQPHTLFFGDFRSKKAKKISVKKGKKIFGPKMVQKWPKNGQKWPKLPQNRRNNSRRSPRKSQQILKISEKWPKTLPQCKVKMHQQRQKWQKMTKNWQKWPKNGKNCIKNRFSLQQLP